MAKSYAHCAIDGCTNQIIFIEQNRKLADRKAAWAEDQGFICSECQEKKRLEEDRLAAERNAFSGLPQLTGSKKKILWAEKIRADKLGLLDTIPDIPIWQMHAYFDWHHLRNFFSHDEQEKLEEQYQNKADFFKVAIQLSFIKKGLDILKNQTKASWWIDNRESKLSYIIAELLKALPAEQPEENKPMEVNAQAEATIRPETPVTETVAEIKALANKITVSFPEKVESFRLLMRNHGFTWSGSAWVRDLTSRSGTPFDRAAEIGHILLGSGFIIRIYDESIRALAINGAYLEEQTRWITGYTSGSEKGRLCVSWGRDDDFYKAAKRLPTARYVKPALSVAVEQFEQVLDFAEINGFSISDTALKFIDAAREAKAQALTAHIELSDKVTHSDDGKPVSLVVPDSVVIDDSLSELENSDNKLFISNMYITKEAGFAVYLIKNNFGKCDTYQIFPKNDRIGWDGIYFLGEVDHHGLSRKESILAKNIIINHFNEHVMHLLSDLNTNNV